MRCYLGNGMSLSSALQGFQVDDDGGGGRARWTATAAHDFGGGGRARRRRWWRWRAGLTRDRPGTLARGYDEGLPGTYGDLVRVTRLRVCHPRPVRWGLGGTLMRVLPVRGGRYGGPPSICRLHRIGRWKSPLGNRGVGTGQPAACACMSRKQGADVPGESSICKAALKSANGEFSG